jgi:RNA polymerase sigma-70 factor (sigma-E family)
VRQHRDVTAFSDLVATRSAALLRTAYLVMCDHQLAQDLVQESLVKTYVAWPRLRDVTKAEAYARRTIVTTAISWRRRRSFHERPVLAIPEQAQADRTDAFATQDLLWAHVCALPPRQRAALVLRYYEDLSEADTAQLMGCAVGTVKSQVSAGLDRLRQRMGPEVSGLLVGDPTDDPAVTS